MLSLKCFDCDGIGNFSSKCPYDKNKGRMKNKILRRKIKIKRETREGTKINSSRKVST